MTVHAHWGPVPEVVLNCLPWPGLPSGFLLNVFCLVNLEAVDHSLIFFTKLESSRTHRNRTVVAQPEIEH